MGVADGGPRLVGTPSSEQPLSAHLSQTTHSCHLGGLSIGVAWRPVGKRAHASAGGNNEIRVYDVQGTRAYSRHPFRSPLLHAGR